MHIILHQPEIASNTGNIGRTCAAAGCDLHLIEPLGFRLTDRAVARSGMDYWHELSVTRWVNYEQLLEAHPDARIFYVTTKAERCYTDVAYRPDDWLMFGKESGGIPEEILAENRERCVRIPMLPGTRSLNLSNSVAVVLYEALRQSGFPGMERSGHLHRLGDW